MSVPTEASADNDKPKQRTGPMLALTDIGGVLVPTPLLIRDDPDQSFRPLWPTWEMSQAEPAKSTTPTSTPPSLVVETSSPRNIFRRDGSSWTVCYNGGALFALPLSPGSYYISCLLERPGKPFAPSELRAAYIRFQQKPDERGIMEEADTGRCLEARLSKGTADLGELLDAEGVAVIRQTLSEIEQGLDEAERTYDDLEKQRLTEEKQKLTAFLTASFRPGGQARKMQERLKKDRDVVRNAITRVLDKIAEKSTELHTHLQNSLRLRNYPLLSYNPEKPTAWHL